MKALLLPLLIAAFEQMPLEAGEGAQFFVAPISADGGKAVFLAQADVVSVFAPPNYATPTQFALPADTAYIDVADLDADGAADLIVVAGSAVYTTSLATAAPLRARGTLTSPATSARGPVPTYLAHRLNGQIVLRVPSRNGFENLLVQPVADGVVLAPLPNAPDAHPPESPSADAEPAPDELEQPTPDAATPPASTTDDVAAQSDTADAEAIPQPNPDDTPTNADTPVAVELFAVTPPQVAPADGAEYVMQPYGEIAVAPAAESPHYQRSGTVAQARDAADRPAEDWPWFRLQPGSDGGRALFALDPPDFDRTLIRIAADPAGAAGPARLYPGAVVPPRDVAPDFNGDGWADLLLWRAPAPTFSLSSLTRWAQTGRWSLDLMTHLFDPTTKRFDARPAAVLRTRVPLVGFLEPEAGLPVSLWTVGDFDGDGHDDLLLKTEPQRLDVWLYRDGFADEPDAALRFPAPVTGIEFAGPLAQNGPTILAVRTQTGRHLVWYEE